MVEALFIHDDGTTERREVNGAIDFPSRTHRLVKNTLRWTARKDDEPRMMHIDEISDEYTLQEWRLRGTPIYCHHLKVDKAAAEYLFDTRSPYGKQAALDHVHSTLRNFMEDNANVVLELDSGSEVIPHYALKYQQKCYGWILFVRKKMTPYEQLSTLVEGRALLMSIELFERKCLHVVQSIPLDDPLADTDLRELAANTVRLCREFIDYRKTHGKLSSSS